MIPRENNTDEKTKIKVFFHKKKWRETLVFCFFLVLAVGFWLLESLQGESEITVDIPLLYKNVPSQIAFNQTPPEKIKVVLKDKGTVLIGYLFGEKIIPLDIDLSSLNIEKNTYTVSDDYLSKEIRKKLMTTTGLQTYSPSELLIRYDVLKQKKVPVLFNGLLLPAPGFMLFDDIRFTPSEITIYGPENILDTIKGIYTQRIDTNKIDRNLKIKVGLLSFQGVKPEPAEVELSASVEEFTEKIFNLPIQVKNMPQQLILRTFPAVIQVTCLLPISQYNEIEDTDLEVGVDYADFDTTNSSTIPVKMIRKPVWLKNYRLSPERVEFLLEEQKNYD